MNPILAHKQALSERKDAQTAITCIQCAIHAHGGASIEIQLAEDYKFDPVAYAEDFGWEVTRGTLIYSIKLAGASSSQIKFGEQLSKKEIREIIRRKAAAIPKTANRIPPKLHSGNLRPAEYRANSEVASDSAQSGDRVVDGHYPRPRPFRARD